MHLAPYFIEKENDGGPVYAIADALIPLRELPAHSIKLLGPIGKGYARIECDCAELLFEFVHHLCAPHRTQMFIFS